MRCVLFALLLLLAACASNHDGLDKTPTSLRVGSVALSSGIPSIALSIARRDLAINPNNVGALLIEANALSEMDQPNGAETSFRRALRLSPGSQAAQIGLGRILLGNGHAREAERLFRDVLKTSPADPRAANDLGIALDLQGKHSQAQDFYKIAIEAAPDMQGPQVNLGLSYALDGKAAQAIDILRPLANTPNASLRIHQDLALALVAAGDREEAERILRREMPTTQVAAAMQGYTRFGATESN